MKIKEFRKVSKINPGEESPGCAGAAGNGLDKPPC
jgi:hypothetical protein